MDNKGFTLLECMIACTIASIVLLGIHRLSISAFTTYNSYLSAKSVDNESSIVYYAFKNRIDNALKVEIYDSYGKLITYEDSIVELPLARINLYYDNTTGSCDQSFTLSTNGELIYATSAVQDNIRSIKLNKQANSAIVTISYQFKNDEEIFYYIANLGTKGMVNYIADLN